MRFSRRFSSIFAVFISLLVFSSGSVFSYSAETNSLTRLLRFTVFHIHDVHKNHQAQLDIADQVRKLIKNNPDVVVALEGFSGRYDPTAVRSFVLPNLVATVSQNLLEQNKISGAIHGVWTADHNAQVVGIDDDGHHESNVTAYLRSRYFFDKAEAKLRRDEARISKEKRLLFHRSLRRFDAMVEKFTTTQSELSAYLSEVAANAPENYPEIARYVRVDSAERDFQMNRAILTQAVHISGERLLSETKVAEKAAYEHLCQNENERKLVSAGRRLRLVRKLLTFSLTRQEWEDYKLQRFHQQTDLEPFESFYREAEIRDALMAKNVLSLAKKNKTIVLVTGGFHAASMDRALVAAGGSVQTFVPKISRPICRDGSSYLNSFLADHPVPHRALVELVDEVGKIALQRKKISAAAFQGWAQKVCEHPDSSRARKNVIADRLLRVLGLDDRLKIAVLLQKSSSDGPVLIETIELPEGPMKHGLEILRERLKGNRFFLLHRHNRLIAVYPDPAQFKDKRGLEYFDFSPFYTDVPQFGTDDMMNRWAAFATQREQDFKEVDYFANYLCTLNHFKYFYPVSKEAYGFNLVSVDVNARHLSVTRLDLKAPQRTLHPLLSTNAHVRRFILPIFPTVYNPEPVFGEDKAFYETVLKSGLTQEWSDNFAALVVGAGSGFDSVILYLAWLLSVGEDALSSKRQPKMGFRLRDINPIARENALVTAALVGFPVDAQVGDNAPTEGNFDMVVWNMPAAYDRHRPPTGVSARFEFAHDGDPDFLTLRVFASRLPALLRTVGGLGIFWNTNGLSNIAVRLFETAGRSTEDDETPKLMDVEKLSRGNRPDDAATYTVTHLNSFLHSNRAVLASS